MEKKRILVVDDEEDLCEIIRYNLEQAGYEVDTALSAEEALMMNVNAYDLILLDVMMGEMSGFKMAEIIRKNTKNKRVPIIFCTAKDTEEDLVKGLELGGDDYIEKPFSVKEMIARVKAVIRRATDSVPLQSDQKVFSYEKLELDPESKKVTIEGNEVDLTKTEFEILWHLLQNTRKVYSREDFLHLIWPDEVCVSDRTVDVHITRLRKKIAPYGKRIISRSGYGYYFETK